MMRRLTVRLYSLFGRDLLERELVVQLALDSSRAKERAQPQRHIAQVHRVTPVS